MSVLTHTPLNSHHNHSTFIWNKNSGFWNYFPHENFQGSPNDLTKSGIIFLNLTLWACLLHLALVTAILLFSGYSPPSVSMGAEPMVLYHFMRGTWVSTGRENAGSNPAQIPRDECAFSSWTASLCISLTFLLLYNSRDTYGWIQSISFMWMNTHGEIFFLYWKEMRYHKG